MSHIEQERENEVSFADVLIQEYSKLSALLHDVTDRIEQGCNFSESRDNLFTLDYIRETLESSGSKVNQTILDMKMLVEDIEEEED